MTILVLIQSLSQALPTSSLNDTEYDEIISLAIQRAMTGGIPSPDTGNSDMENEMEVKTAAFITN
jgi:hypothetical protein